MGLATIQTACLFSYSVPWRWVRFPPSFVSSARVKLNGKWYRYPCIFALDLWGGGSADHKVQAMSQLPDFIRIRKLFTYGPTRDYWDHPQCIGWVREGDGVHDGCAVVLCIGSGEGEKRMQIPDGHAGEVWTDVLGWHQGEVTIGDDVRFSLFSFQSRLQPLTSCERDGRISNARRTRFQCGRRKTRKVAKNLARSRLSCRYYTF